MNLNNVDVKNGKAILKFRDDEEIDLIEEAMNRLIKKQSLSVIQEKNDLQELNKLEKYKRTKFVAVEKQKERRKKLKEDKIKYEKEKKDKPPKPVIAAQNPTEEIAYGDGAPGTEPTNYEDVELTFVDNGNEIEVKNMYDIVTAVNGLIDEMERNGTFQSEENDQRLKYEKLKKILAKAQESKALFERVTPKPKGYGRLKK